MLPLGTFARRLKDAALLVPALGLLELGAHVFFSRRAPTKGQWDDIRPLVASWYEPGEVVVIAPYWAEPMARWSFGDSLMPTREVARGDITGYVRAIEVATLGSRSPELAGWNLLREDKHGPFTVREVSNPASPRVTYDFVDHIDAHSADVRIDAGATSIACSFITNAAVESGGLGAPPTYPATRFSCPGQPTHVFVGVTVIEDGAFRPRRCIWSHPPAGEAEIVTRFRDVHLGSRVHGHAGMGWVVERFGLQSPFTIRVMVGGVEVGRMVHQSGEYWKEFDIPMGAWAGRTTDVAFHVSAPPGGAHVCYEADSR
jgi:hypothetical protein